MFVIRCQISCITTTNKIGSPVGYQNDLYIAAGIENGNNLKVTASVCLSVCLCLCLSVCLSVSVSVYVSVSVSLSDSLLCVCVLITVSRTTVRR